jgi:ribosomal protein S18 acetylase RimI-like enzyme
MYVTPPHRRQGIGSRLLEAALRHAAAVPGVSWVHLSVSAAAPAAQRLYERVGFHVRGSEPEALHHEGRTVTEHHLARRVTAA